MKPFGFLNSLNLSSVGLGLNEVPTEFGWDLVLFEPILEQSWPKGVLGPSKVQTEVFDVVNDLSLSEGDSNSILVETWHEPIPDVGEAGIEPPPV